MRAHIHKRRHILVILSHTFHTYNHTFPSQIYLYNKASEQYYYDFYMSRSFVSCKNITGKVVISYYSNSKLSPSFKYVVHCCISCAIADHPDCRPLQARTGSANGGVPVSHRKDFQSVLHGGSHSLRPDRDCRQLSQPTAIQLTLLLFALSIFSTVNKLSQLLIMFSPLDSISTFLC